MTRNTNPNSTSTRCESCGTRKPRPHNRTTMLTTTKATFDTLKSLKAGEGMAVSFPNDVISSARGGLDNEHHSIRRVSLIRRQIRGGYTRVNVRYKPGQHITCRLLGAVNGADDDCVCRANVVRI